MTGNGTNSATSTRSPHGDQKKDSGPSWAQQPRFSPRTKGGSLMAQNYSSPNWEYQESPKFSHHPRNHPTAKQHGRSARASTLLGRSSGETSGPSSPHPKTRKPGGTSSKGPYIPAIGIAQTQTTLAGYARTKQKAWLTYCDANNW